MAQNTPMHPLDNPAWAALCTSHQHLARSTGLAQRYDPDYAIFATAVNHSFEPLAALGALIAQTGPAIVLEKDPLPPVPNTIVQTHRLGVQMLAETPKPADPGFAFDILTDTDAPEMRALAMLTEPGPFFARTHQLGRFIGIRRAGQLIAMAGERMRTHGFTEVSGVCTHPDFRGLGLAGKLMRAVAARIVAAGDTPFRHAYADNEGAIGLYERLGYRHRIDVNVTVLAPA